MNALDELKTRARVRLNAGRREAGGSAGAGPRLRDELVAAAREVGFRDWVHAQRVLGGLAAAGEDLGDLWYAPRCGFLLNEWFAALAPAREAHARQSGAFLLPYRRQFVVAQDAFVRELGLDPSHDAWSALRRDLAAGYGSAAWQALSWQRVRAPRSTFARR